MMKFLFLYSYIKKNSYYTKGREKEFSSHLLFNLKSVCAFKLVDKQLEII